MLNKGLLQMYRFFLVFFLSFLSLCAVGATKEKKSVRPKNIRQEKKVSDPLTDSIRSKSELMFNLFQKVVSAKDRLYFYPKTGKLKILRVCDQDGYQLVPLPHDYACLNDSYLSSEPVFLPTSQRTEVCRLNADSILSMKDPSHNRITWERIVKPKKSNILFTISTQPNGKRISDLLNDMNKAAPIYPPYPGESVDSDKKAVGMFTGEYSITEKSEKIQQGCPICKSKNSFTEHYVFDVDFSCEISLPLWTNLKNSSRNVQNEWNKFIAGLLEHEEAHLLDFKTQFMDKIFPLKHIVQACFECDKKGYNNLQKNKMRIRKELFNTYIKHIKDVSLAEQSFTKRVENEFLGYDMDPNLPLSP